MGREIHFGSAAAATVATQVSGTPAGLRQHLQGPAHLSPETRLVFWPSERSSHQSCCCREYGVIRGHSNSSVTPLAPLLMHKCSPCCRCAQTEPEWLLCLSQNDSLMSHLLCWSWAWFPRSARSPSFVFFSCFAPWMRNSRALWLGHVVFSWRYGSHLTLSPANRQKAHPPLNDTQKQSHDHPRYRRDGVFLKVLFNSHTEVSQQIWTYCDSIFFANL